LDDGSPPILWVEIQKNLFSKPLDYSGPHM
jgi:hypothetical protein